MSTLRPAPCVSSARQKGRKLRRAHDRPVPQLLPLLPQAVDAFKIFDA
jgi:hypothetical protein